MRDSFGALKRFVVPLLLLALGLYVVVLVRTAWLCDDAYITFRTVDNAIHGFGLTWNTAERVQAYTHPLWMLALVGATWLTGSVYYAAIGLGLALSVATVLLLALRAESPGAALFGVTLLVLSRAFVDYSTSGLENPLAHFLLVSFCLAASGRPDSGRLFAASLIAALSLVNRLDSALLILPALGYLFVQTREGKRIRAVAAGFVPLAAWELFALVYYGFPFPNTAYAKLVTGIPRIDLIRQGLDYLFSEAHFDLVTLLAILLGLVIAWAGRDPLDRWLACGIVLHLAYVVYVGGDFMSGRFLSSPLLLSVILIAGNFHRFGRRTAAAATLALVAVGLIWPDPTVSSGKRYGYANPRLDERGVADERSVYYRYTGLLRDTTVEDRSEIDMIWARQGRELRGGRRLHVSGNIGFLGYYAGPRAHIIDRCGLADPLLARLPAMDLEQWRVGHFDRAVPPGYAESIVTGENRIRDAEIAAYYDRLARITRGPIFARGRLAAIFRMNLGLDRPPRYDH